MVGLGQQLVGMGRWPRAGWAPTPNVFGRNFGNDVIDDVEPAEGAKEPDTIRFADIASTEISARRDGLDLILRVDSTGDQVRVVRQSEGRLPSLFGGDLSDDTLATLPGLAGVRTGCNRGCATVI